MGEHLQQWIAALTSAQMSQLWGGQPDVFGTLDCQELLIEQEGLDKYADTYLLFLDDLWTEHISRSGWLGQVVSDHRQAAPRRPADHLHLEHSTDRPTHRMADHGNVRENIINMQDANQRNRRLRHTNK